MTKKIDFGPVMLDLEGFFLLPEEKEKLAHPNTGAVILFARNYESPEQVKELIRQIRAARRGDILLAVDQEGGRVQRFQQGLTRLPAARFYQDHPELTQASGWLMASELLAVGIDFSFAPVLDVDSGVSEIIGDRAFSEDCRQVTELAGKFMQGMMTAGMAATGKHFPGHGAVAADSHLTLPEDRRDLSEIEQHDLVPFKALIKQGMAAVMPAHVVYSAVDALPAGFSTLWLQQILRQQLGFDGVIFSDDLSMEGASLVGDFKDRADAALAAGCDMVLVCNQPQAAEQVLEHLPVQENPDRQRRLEKMRGHAKYSRQELAVLPQWQEISRQIQA
ncbi:beta-N-acetylhexosaminidase [methane-oxidizing endosymbiont of Gigantopelta aegis]|uniref:beta-N-acetylhexosaminidase n=1 Tax=methane-oxidizing endosymbiont of Gigantopelta aegis TaxID=2794938 RepID=UPI001FD91033|nr:beta-N-acetylhexosaminidase [methane-oxidizing endosymbiont of Gigantopelta aegis]